MSLLEGTDAGALLGGIHTADCRYRPLGGSISILRNGDLFEVDAVKNTINLLIPAAEYHARMAANRPRPPRETRGVLAKYAKLVVNASEGAVTDKYL